MITEKQNGVAMLLKSLLPSLDLSFHLFDVGRVITTYLDNYSVIETTYSCYEVKFNSNDAA